MRPDASELIKKLEYEYDQGEGFLGLLRSGRFSAPAAARFRRLLQAVDPGDEGVIDRRVVALLWYVPLIMQWQEPRLSRPDAESMRRTLEWVTAELERILGVP
ncbi:MAG TPA: hypothetical protein VFJ58_10980 [Armatimonadota bacterium]|nr:hypothetical protein [Armatimonadota bacterium]